MHRLLEQLTTFTLNKPGKIIICGCAIAIAICFISMIYHAVKRD